MHTINIFIAGKNQKAGIHYKHRSSKHLHTEFIKLNSRNCQACWQCIDNCPQKVIEKAELFNHRHSHIDTSKKCIGCFKCVKTCSFKAIYPIKETVVLV